MNATLAALKAKAIAGRLPDAWMNAVVETTPVGPVRCVVDFTVKSLSRGVPMHTVTRFELHGNRISVAALSAKLDAA